MASEPGVEDREMGSTVTWKWAGLMFQQGTRAVQGGRFNSRTGFDAGPNKVSRGSSVSLSFGLHSSASVLVWAGSVMELSASESLENNESCAEVSVSIDPQLE